MAIIWLPKRNFPHKQTCNISFKNADKMNFAVTTIKKDYCFDDEIASIDVSFAMDCLGYLTINNYVIANTNLKSPCDFMDGNKPLKDYYLAHKKICFSNETKAINILAFVQLSPTSYYDFSSGFGGFYFNGFITFKNGKTLEIKSDSSWLIRIEKEYIAPNKYVQQNNDEYQYSEVKYYKWNLIDSHITLPIEKDVCGKEFIAINNHRKTYTINFKNIYASYIGIETNGSCLGHIQIFETSVKHSDLFFKCNEQCFFRYMDMQSVGKIKLTLINKTNKDVKVKLHVYHSFYPYDKLGHIKTNNKRLNDLFSKCQFASINCSQTMFLDSPKHLEPFASCVGDYQIISLVFGISNGDYELAKHVLRGCALSFHRLYGQIANSNYALIFIAWLWKIYMITGDKKLLDDCLIGVDSVLKLFKTFIGQKGIIDHPTNYIFLDWLVDDGFNLFCPPMALGQTVLNAFYYEALKCASLIYKELGHSKIGGKYLRESKKLKAAINNVLFDEKRGLYIEGEVTPTPKDYVDLIPDKPIPINPNKIYYRKHGNYLCVAYGLQNKQKSKKIIHKIFSELNDLPIQPYFLHYGFEGIHYANLDKKYAMRLIKEWLKHVKIKDKGLPEGFFKPSPDYVFDYSFIIAASGLKIHEPGMKKISLKLTNLRLKNLEYEIATPYGFIFIKNCKVISCPKEIEILK